LFVIHFDSIKENSMKAKRINILVGFLLFVVLGLSACYPGGPTTADDRDSVVTVFDADANFGAIRTYAMPNEVLVPEDSEDISDEAEAFILGEVARNMANAGYTRELNPEQNAADVLVLVTANRTRNYYGWVNYPWWGWGWGPWGPGWGVGYPWVSIGSYEVGSVFIEMFDPDKPVPSEQQLPAIWGAAMNGLLGSAAGNQAFIAQVVDQAFTQSPYLRAQ
jgi:hypothetical protein